VITPKPASYDHFKTGQASRSGHFGFSAFVPRWATILRLVPFYTDLTWAEDRATQGCDLSADSAAGMAGRRQPPLKMTILADKR
jgi:hypothetical protein